MSSDKSYKEKRNFGKTPDPKSSNRYSSSDKNPVFVIQKHDASNLHYDFRLEIDGTLKSWTVPKGPSTDPSEKRLAIPVEDHPMDYANFEGIIPKGQYGAGTVMIWDKGTYKNIKTENEETIPMEKCYKNGQIEIYLRGEKIYGRYALIKSESKKMDNNWLLVKMDDKHADARRNPTST